MASDQSAAESLSEILDAVWNEWLLAQAQADHPLRLGILGTRPAAGVSQRTLVLRQSDRVSRTLTAFTDVRSEKVREIAANPAVSWLFLDHERKVQIRAAGDVTVHTEDEFAAACWSSLAPVSKLNYQEDLPPGTVVDVPTTKRPRDLALRLSSPADDAEFLTDERLEQGRVNFCVLVTTLHQIDWLRIAPSGHTRCRFRFDESTQEFEGTWLAP